MLVVGTLINFGDHFAAFVMLTQNVAPFWALSVHLAPVPYNTFLLASVWRSQQRTPFGSPIAVIWFVLMMKIKVKWVRVGIIGMAHNISSMIIFSLVDRQLLDHRVHFGRLLHVHHVAGAFDHMNLRRV